MLLADLAQALGETWAGDGNTEICQVGSLDTAGTGQIAFLANSKYRKKLEHTQASAVILHPDEASHTSLPRILSRNPYACYARAAALLNPRAKPPVGVHASAVVDPAAVVAPTASIGPLVSIAAGARIGEGAVLLAGCHIGEQAVIGADTWLNSNVTVYERCIIGARAIVHAGAVIGADGFGFANDGGKWVKIPQIGRVIIGDDVEIGANTAIDRGAMDDTVIADGVKLDNLIQIAHNVRVGADTAMAGCVGVAGSAVIGARCTVGGAANVLGHLELADGVHVTAGTLVTKSITTAGEYSSAMPFMEHRSWLRTAAHIRRLDEMAGRIAELEKALENLKGKERE